MNSNFLKRFKALLASWIAPLFRRDDLRGHVDTADSELRRYVDKVANDSFSYLNFNGQRIDRLKYDLWEGNQKLLDRLYATLPARVGQPIKVVFLVADTSLWGVYQPIYDRLAADAAFEPRVIAFRRVDIQCDKTAAEITEFFLALDIAAEVVGFGDTSYPALEPSDVDVVFYTLGSVAFPEAYRIEYVSMFCRTCYLPYGFMLAEEEEYQYAQDFHQSAWAIYASTGREVELYRKYSKRRSPNAILTGYPKFDILNAECIEFARPARPIVVWAPHWTIGLCYPKLNLGTFDSICMGMVELFRTFPEIDFVFKPHPNLQYALGQTGFMDEKSYSIYQSMLSQCGNVSVNKHGDYSALFLQSSAMITDSVSFLAEYLPTRNPLLFLTRPDRAVLNDVGEKLIELHYQGLGIESIRKFIEQTVVLGHDPMRESRLADGLPLLGLGEQPSSETIRAHLLERFGRLPVTP